MDTRLAVDFWQRWKLEYIHCLQTCKKWQSPGVTFKVNDFVLVKDDSALRTAWPVGIVEEVYPSTDDFIRKDKVIVIREDIRISYIRPITELVHLVECENVFFNALKC